MKRAAIYFREGSYFICASSRTKNGFWIDSKPYIKVKDKDADLGDKILLALEASSQGVDAPDISDSNLGELTKPIVELAGLSSWDDFTKQAKCCHVSLKNGELKIMPTKRSGKEFSHKPNLSVAGHNVDSLGLEQLLEQAVSRCK